MSHTEDELKKAGINPEEVSQVTLNLGKILEQAGFSFSFVPDEKKISQIEFCRNLEKELMEKYKFLAFVKIVSDEEMNNWYEAECSKERNVH